MQYVTAYVATAVIFLVIDIAWLGYVARGFYRENFGALIAEPFNLRAATIFYLIYILGIIVFAVGPALDKKSLGYAALYSALFGFFCYATYDLTNLATLRGFPAKVVPIDILWGTVLTASSAAGGYLVSTMMTR